VASQLTSERWRALEPLLDAALDVPPARRDAFLAESCAGDRVLRADLAQLLSEFGLHDSLFDRPAAERFASLLEEPPERLLDVLNGRYRIERELGRGGMATVYLADDIRHERQVAVKVLRPEIALALGAQRFLTEIRLTAQLQHPHILPLHDSGEADGRLFYVMPYVEGESLRGRLEREKQLPIPEAVRIACEIAGALDTAHRRGVVHRDIKPENILLRDGAALVADFGIALAVSAVAPRVTQPGLALGTPQYMSPEQAIGDGTVDARADIYALGTVLYEMIAGEAPYTGTSGTAIIAKRSAMPPPSLRIHRPMVPAPIEAAVTRALSREPVDRYQTAVAFADGLRQALLDGDSEDATRRLGRATVRRRLALSGLAVTSIALGLGVALFARLGRGAVSPSATTAPLALRSIAVLALADVANDSADGHFAQSMTEFLNTALGAVPGLSVIPSRSTGLSSNSRPQVDFKTLGQKLGVTTLVQGSTLMAGGHLQVILELVSAQDGQRVWSNTYRREIHRAKDVFAVQDEIVKDIVAELQVPTSGTRALTPTHPNTDNLEALDLYSQGRNFFDQRTPEGLKKAERYFERAIATDSNLAQAYTGLSDLYTTYANGNFGDYRPSEFYPKARQLAERALAIDPQSADAHASLGAVKEFYDLDWSGAERELSHALELDPRSSMGHLYRVTLLEFTGRVTEAVAEARAGLDLDPRSIFHSIEYGRALLFARDYARAGDQFTRVLERDSSSFRAHLLLGQVFEQNAKYDSAVREMQAAVNVAGTSSRALAFLAHAQALAGDTNAALRALSVLHDRSQRAYVPAFDFAVVYVGLGRIDETFQWIEKSIDDHSLRPYLMDATFDPIRSGRRYQRLMTKLRIPVDKPAR
jgi:TolB-like protein/tetratricopeptide (TPR) repeat protein